MDTKKLRQKILDLAIRGKLVPQDPNDEPASVLLERIRAEKERLIKEGKIKRSKKSASDTPHYEKMPFEIPNGWEWCIVDDFAYVASGSTPSKDSFVEEGVPYIKMYNLRNQKIEFDFHPQYIKREVHEGKLQRSKTEVGDLIMNIVGPPLGKLAIIPPSLPESNFNQAAVLIRPYLYKDVLVKYLFYYLSEMSEINTIATKGSAGQVNISLTQSQNMRIALPSIEEQKRIIKTIENLFQIVDIIDKGSIDIAMAIGKAKSKILDLAIHGKLVPQDPNDEPAIELLKRINPSFVPCDNAHYPFKVPHNWIWAKGLDIFKPMKATSPLGNTFKYIDIDAIDNKRNVITSVKVLNTKQTPSRASRYTEKGCVLFSMVRPYLRNIAMVTEDDCIASTGFFVCHGENCLLPKFCYFQMLSNYVVDGLNDFMKGDNSPSITKVQIEEFPFPLPPLNEQKRIVAKIEELFAVLDEIQKSIEV